MNAHIHEALTEIALESGAIVGCSICGNYDILAEDDEAERAAYAMATNAWKNGRLRGVSLEETRFAMQSLLRNANNKCPSCEPDACGSFTG